MNNTEQQLNTVLNDVNVEKLEPFKNQLIYIVEGFFCNQFYWAGGIEIIDRYLMQITDCVDRLFLGSKRNFSERLFSKGQKTDSF